MLFVDLFLWQTSVIHISNEGNFPRILLLQELGILITLHRCWSRPLTVHTGSSSTVYGHAIQLAFKSILWANTWFHYLFLFEWNIKNIYIMLYYICKMHILFTAFWLLWLLILPLQFKNIFLNILLLVPSNSNMFRNMSNSIIYKPVFPTLGKAISCKVSSCLLTHLINANKHWHQFQVVHVSNWHIQSNF